VNAAIRLLHVWLALDGGERPSDVVDRAAEFGTTQRTLLRDVEMLKQADLLPAGLPICGWCNKPSSTIVRDEHDGKLEPACSACAALTRKARQ
jgi:hypothetical protein